MYAQSIKSAYYKCRRSTFIIHRPRRWHPSYCHRVHVYGKPDSATLATCHALRRNTDLVVHGYGRLTAMFHCFAWCVCVGGGVWRYGGVQGSRYYSSSSSNCKSALCGSARRARLASDDDWSSTSQTRDLGRPRSEASTVGRRPNASGRWCCDELLL